MSQRRQNVPASDPETGPPPADDLRKLGAQLDELEELIREHPLAALGLAAATGLVVALLLSRR